MVSFANPQIDGGSVPARFRQELRNPSMITVLIAIIAVMAIPLGLLVPKWASITQDSFQQRAAAGDQRDAAILSASALVTSHIIPWMMNEVKRLETAENPAQWNSTSFTEGPCALSNLSSLPAGKHTDAIVGSCSNLLQIQLEFSENCSSAMPCNVSEAALMRLSAIRHELISTFSGAGFVSDYRAYDERWTR